MKLEKQSVVPSDYQPNDQILKLALENDISPAFIKKQRSEFVFYWQEKGTRRKNWHRSFWNWLKKGWEWEKEKKIKNKRTHPMANDVWEGEVIEKSTTKKSLKEMLRETA